MIKLRLITTCYLYSISLISLLFLSGCSSTVGYKKPISDFQDATSVVTESSRVYITQLNKTQRDAYIDQQVNEAKQISLLEIEKKQVFKPEALEVRLGALKQLSKYGELLGQLANSDAPEKITSNAGDLAESLKKLQGNIEKYSGSDDKDFKDAFGPVAVIISEVARIAVEKQMQVALDKAITGGEEPITKLIRVIRDDLVTAYELKRTAVSNNRTIYVDGYEVERLKKRDFEILRMRGEEIKAVLDGWEAFPTSNPTDGLDALVTAHSALVSYAKSKKQPEDLEALVVQMEAFVARAKRVGNATRQLQHLTNN